MKKKKQKKSDEYFDDCAVCLYMKSVEEGKEPPTIEELKKAFKEAGKQGGFVGGPLIEEDESKN